MTALKLGELFAGYGGLGMAVEEVFGAELAWVSEWEAAPSKILAHHWPTVPNHGDVTKIEWAAIEPVDIISGGSPCQDISGAGNRRGMTEGTRSNLWAQMREGIAIIRPRYVVWENVRGAFSAEASCSVEQCAGCVGNPRDGRVFLRALGRVLGDLSDLGYDCRWETIRAADAGAPHGRSRVFVLATDASRGTRDSWRGSAPGQEESRWAHGGSRGRSGVYAPTHPGGIGLEAGRLPGGSAQEVSEHHDRLRVFREYSAAVQRWERVTRQAPEPTIMRTGGKRPTLNIPFVEWMMGLPEGWVTDPAIGLNRADQLKALGNGVVPQQAIAALRDMLAAFEMEKAA